jgi:hypothetical protein
VKTCNHLYINHVSIPHRLFGAVLGYDDYRECKLCARRVPADSLTDEERQRARTYLGFISLEGK